MAIYIGKLIKIMILVICFILLLILDIHACPVTHGAQERHQKLGWKQSKQLAKVLWLHPQGTYCKCLIFCIRFPSSNDKCQHCLRGSWEGQASHCKAAAGRNRFTAAVSWTSFSAYGRSSCGSVLHLLYVLQRLTVPCALASAEGLSLFQGKHVFNSQLNTEVWCMSLEQKVYKLMNEC